MATNLAIATLAVLVVLALIRINRLERKLTMSDASNAAAIRGMTAQVAKVKTEVLAAIAKLEGEVATAGATPETDAAIEEARTALQGLDDLNADAADPAAAGHKRKG